MKRVMLIVNPTSGGERAPEFAERTEQKLAEFFGEVVVKHTEKAGDATVFAREAAEQEYHSVFVMGGDGTINEGINGLAEQPYRPNFGFIPLGTMNDLARSFEIPLNPEAAIENIDPSSWRYMDVGKANGKYFMNVVALGAIPTAVNETAIERKTRFGNWAYILDGLKAFTASDSHIYRMTLDGETLEAESSLILIASIDTTAGIEGLTPLAEADDGLLHLVYVKDRSLAETLRAVPQLLSGVDRSSNAVGYKTFKKGRVEVLDGAEVIPSIDGDPGEPLPLDVEVLERHLRVYV